MRGGLLPHEIFCRDHLQAWEHQTGCDSPSADAAFHRGLAQVEVETAPLGIERLDNSRHVPDGLSDIARVIVITDLYTVVLCQLHQAAKLPPCYVNFLQNVYKLVTVVAGFQVGNGQLSSRADDLFRRGIVSRKQCGRDHRDFKSFFSDRCHRSWKVRSHTLRKNMSLCTDRQINSIETGLPGVPRQFPPVQLRNRL